MRNFIKNNLISIIGFTLFFSTVAGAGVVSRIYEFVGGEKAVATQVNAEFDNLIDFLMGGNIASNNIAAFGVWTSNINDLAVTTGKIATSAVTNAKLATDAVATSNIQDGAVTSAKVSLNSNIATGNTVQTSTILSGVTGEFATGNITTGGKPIIIALQYGLTQSGTCSSGTLADGKGGYLEFQAGGGSDRFCFGDMTFNLDGVDIATVRVAGFSGASGGGDYLIVPASTFQHQTKVIAAGAHTVKMKLRPGAQVSGCSVNIQCVRLVLNEVF